MRRTLLHSSNPGGISSAIATSTPGRIYAEARNFVQVAKLARSFAELNPLQVCPVPREEVFRILNISSSHIHWPWAKVHGSQEKWRPYAGDTGLITRVEGRNKKYLALIPRIHKLDGTQAGQSRPPQALAVRSNLGTCGAVRTELYGGYTWRGHLFSPEGVLLVDLDNIAVLPLSKPLPSSAELTLFRSTSLLSTAEVEKTAQQVEQTRLKVGDRVKFVSGPYLDLIGEIKEIKENEVTVYVPSQNIVDDMPKDSVRADFAIGDRVNVLDGKNRGLVGWVIGISVRTLQVLNLETETEVNSLSF